MRVLLVNNFSHKRGGADISLFNTAKLLRKKGHRVYYFFAEETSSFRLCLPVGRQTRRINPFNLLYSFASKRKISHVLEDTKPDIVHLNNIYHHLSPSIIDEIKKRDIPIVFNIQDYKLVCALYKLWRNGQVCMDCKNKCFLNILKNNCNLKGYLGENFLLWTEMQLHHNILHIYDKVDVFISPSKFLIKKFKEMGWRGKIEYLPNFVFVSEYKPHCDYKERGIVYFGRLAPEKGLLTLIKAMKGLSIELNIIGTGQLENELRRRVGEGRIQNIKFSGWLTGEALRREIRRAMFTVLPSEWYENNPRSIIESFALGKTVVASAIGGIPELVRNEYNGLLFRPGEAQDLRNKINWLIKHERAMKQMGKRGRKLIEKKYNEEICYKKLMSIYKAITPVPESPAF